MPQATATAATFSGKDQGEGKLDDRTSITSAAQPNSSTTSMEAWQFFRSANFEAHPNKPKESVPRKQNMSPVFISASVAPQPGLRPHIAPSPDSMPEALISGRIGHDINLAGVALQDDPVSLDVRVGTPIDLDSLDNPTPR